MAFKFVVLCSVLAIANAGLFAPVNYAPSHAVAYANTAVDAVAATHENVVRSFGGTVSTHSKAIDTPYSSVRKQDTRISNNDYTPSYAKTVAYAAPAVTKTVAYAAPAPAAADYAHTAPAYSAPAPAVYEHHEAEPTAAVYTQAAPVVTKQESYAAPAINHVSYAAPVVTKQVSYAAPAVNHVSYAAPAVAKHVRYAAPAQTVSYAAPAVAQHVSYAAPVTTTYNHGPAASTYAHNAPGISAYGSSQTVHYSPADLVSHMSFDGFGTHWGWN